MVIKIDSGKRLKTKILFLMASRIKTISMSVILLIVLLFVGCGNQTNSANENDSLNITEEQIELKKIEEEILDKNKEQDCSVSNITITDIDGDKYTVSYTIQKGRGSDVAKINVTNSIFKKISEYFILIDRGDYDVRSVGSGSNSGTTNSSVQKTSSKV